jgi:hypothetical protein
MPTKKEFFMKKHIMLFSLFFSYNLSANEIKTETINTEKIEDKIEIPAKNLSLIKEGEETKYLVLRPNFNEYFTADFAKQDPAKIIHLETHRILSNIVESYYEHTTTIDEANGFYSTDCSGLAAYILRYNLPSHYDVINDAKITGQTRPLASDFCTFFRNCPNISDPTKNPLGWMTIKYLRNVKQGDIIAWDYVQDKKNTGHVVIVDTIVTKFSSSVTIDGNKYWEYKVRIIDASSGTHYQDTRDLDKNVTGQGIGAGCMYFGVNIDGEVKYYKWSSRSGTPNFEIFGIGRAIPMPEITA